MESRRPKDEPFMQQRLPDLQLRLNINGFIAVFFVVGLLFVPSGVYLRNVSNAVLETVIRYDGTNSDVSLCDISQTNAGLHCNITISFDKDVSGPLYLYYQIDHFYQNHRRYVKSRSAAQLMGENLKQVDVASDCYPMIANGSSVLNPCGLIANTFFNDIIELVGVPTGGIELDTDGIAWSYDTEEKFRQVKGFVQSPVSNLSQSCAEVLGVEHSDCKTYFDADTHVTHYYWYPDDDSVQYLHESFPTTISPLDGVTDEHFINWMRTAGLPNFRKLYGKIDTDIRSGDSLTFDLTLNFEVSSYGGAKSLVVTNLAFTGAKSETLAITYIVIGSFSLFFGALFALKRLIKPRPLGDIRELSWGSY